MTPDRWRQINELFHAALDQPPHAARRSSCANASDGDAELAREVRIAPRQPRCVRRVSRKTRVRRRREPDSRRSRRTALIGQHIGSYAFSKRSVAAAWASSMPLEDSRLGRMVALKALARRVHHRPDSPRAADARSARRRIPFAPGRRHGLRARGNRRRTLPHLRAGARGDAARGAGRGALRPSVLLDTLSDIAAGLGRRPRGRHRPPRSQTGEHHPLRRTGTSRFSTSALRASARDRHAPRCS